MLLIGIIAMVVFSFCYARGGQPGGRNYRRFIGPIIFAVLLIAGWVLNHRFNWLSSIGAILFLASSNGFSYGVKFTHNKFWLKVLFRGLVGASYGLCGLLIGIGADSILLGIAQLLTATLGSIIFGVLNPVSSSWGNTATRVEDICISLCYVCVLPFII